MSVSFAAEEKMEGCSCLQETEPRNLPGELGTQRGGVGSFGVLPRGAQRGSRYHGYQARNLEPSLRFLCSRCNGSFIQGLLS